MLISQPGSTLYPLTEFQMRQAARVQLEYTFLLDQNKSMYEMLQWCEQARVQDSIALAERDVQLDLKDQQIANRQKSLIQWEAKYQIIDEQRRKERGRKNIFLTTTIITTATTLVLLLKPN